VGGAYTVNGFAVALQAFEVVAKRFCKNGNSCRFEVYCCIRLPLALKAAQCVRPPYSGGALSEHPLPAGFRQCTANNA
jgi:hypothetical protein